jgi:manganese oxidase
MSSRVRPFTMIEKKNKKGLPLPMNTLLTAPAKIGATALTVHNAGQYHVGTLILVGATSRGNRYWVPVKCESIASA